MDATARREELAEGGQARSDMPAFQPYWGKPAVRNDRGDNGNVSIIRSLVRAIVLPDHVFVSYRPHQQVSQIMQWNKLAGAVAGVSHLRKKFWGRHFWGRGYLAVSSGTITDEMIQEYIEEQEGEQIADDGRFPIDNS